MTTGTISICVSCSRLRPRDDGEFGVACDAFPGGIPDEIYVQGFDHRQPFSGDQGIRYDPDSSAAERLSAYERTLT